MGMILRDDGAYRGAEYAEIFSENVRWVLTHLKR